MPSITRQRTKKQIYFGHSVDGLTVEIDRLKLKKMELERQYREFPNSESLKREIARYEKQLQPLIRDRAKYLPFI